MPSPQEPAQTPVRSEVPEGMPASRLLVVVFLLRRDYDYEGCGMHGCNCVTSLRIRSDQSAHDAGLLRSGSGSKLTFGTSCHAPRLSLDCLYVAREMQVHHGTGQAIERCHRRLVVGAVQLVDTKRALM